MKRMSNEKKFLFDILFKIIIKNNDECFTLYKGDDNSNLLICCYDKIWSVLEKTLHTHIAVKEIITSVFLDCFNVIVNPNFVDFSDSFDKYY